MFRQLSTCSVVSLLALAVAANPAFAAPPPIEKTLSAFGLTETQDGVFTYAKRTIDGSVATYSGIKLGEVSAQSLIVNVSQVDGPGAITSARFTNVSAPGSRGSREVMRLIEIGNPSVGFFKGPLEALAKGPDAFSNFANGLSASSIRLEGLVIPDDETVNGTLDLIRLEGFSVRDKQVQFKEFEVSGLKATMKSGERVALRRFLVGGPNVAMMRGLFASTQTKEKSEDTSTASDNPFVLFDGASAKEWRIEGLEVDVPKPPTAKPAADDEDADAQAGTTKVSYASSEPDDDSEAELGEDEEFAPTSPPPAPFGPASFRLGTFAILDQEGDKVGKVLIKDVSAKGEAPFVDTFDVSIAELSITKLDLGPFLMAARAGMAAASASPGDKPVEKPNTTLPANSGLALGYEGVKVRSFQISAGGVQLDLGSVELTSRKDGAGRIIGFDTTPFSYAFRVLDPKTSFGAISRMTLDTLGYKDIVLSGPASVTDYTPATDELVLKGGLIELKDGFASRFGYSLLGFRDYFDKAITLSATPSTSPAAVLELLGALKVKSLSVSFEDRSIIARLAKWAAPKDGSKTPEKVRSEWVGAAQAAAKDAKPGSFTRLVATSVADFLRTPNQTWEFNLSPPKPIGLNDFGSKEPDPKVLGLSVSVR